MATIENFRSWWDRDLGRFAPWKTSVQIRGVADTRDHKELEIRIFTDKNRYSITAREPQMRRRPLVQRDDCAQMVRDFLDDTNSVLEMDSGYLGCISTSRRWRAGEEHHRGSDLADGPLTEEIWHRILADIVAYELVEISKDVREPRAQGSVLGDMTQQQSTVRPPRSARAPFGMGEKGPWGL